MCALKLYDALAANPMAVRLFILERGGLSIDIQQVDIMKMENRKPKYMSNVNSRGEVPALRLPDGSVLTEIAAITEYLDEIAKGGSSLYGSTPEQRAETRMWLRRMDLEICEPVMAWYRNDPESLEFYRGHRIPCPEARLSGKVAICRALNRLDDELEGRTWLCGERFSAADVHFYGLMKLMSVQAVPFLVDDARKNVKGYFDRMDERAASKEALMPFKEATVNLEAR